MSAVQAGGGKGSGQKPGSTAGGRPAAGTKPSPGTAVAPTGPARPPAAGPARPRSPAPAAPAAGLRQGRRRQGAASSTERLPARGKPPQRFSPSTLAFVAVAVVVVIIVAFVVVKVTGSNKPSAATRRPGRRSSHPPRPPWSTEVHERARSVASAVGLPSTSTVAPPTVKTGQPPLTIGGQAGGGLHRRRVLPALRRRAMGHHHGLQQVRHLLRPAGDDLVALGLRPVHADLLVPRRHLHQSLHHLRHVEHESNDKNGLGTRTLLAAPHQQERPCGPSTTRPRGLPLPRHREQVLRTSPELRPAVLGGLDQADIASRLQNPKDPVTTDIVGTANYLTAGICAITGQKPASVCSAPIVARADEDHGPQLSP